VAKPAGVSLHDTVLSKLSDGDFSELIAYLRSEHCDREYLAKLLEDDLEFYLNPDPVGRPRDELKWELVEAAESFYQEWKKRNKEAGIRDRGLHKKMKYLSCEYTVEVQAQVFGEGSHRPSPEVLLRALSRPKNRRNKK
jgi:hypothetical protein